MQNLTTLGGERLVVINLHWLELSLFLALGLPIS